jgi:hypothetical protein
MNIYYTNCGKGESWVIHTELLIDTWDHNLFKLLHITVSLYMQFIFQFIEHLVLLYGIFSYQVSKLL